MASKLLCIKALNAYEPRLSALQNVVGLGITLSSDEVPIDSDDLVVAVYVERKLPLKELEEGDRVPKTLSVEHQGQIVHVGTRVIEQGLPEAESLGSSEQLC